MNVFPAFIPLWDARILIVGDTEGADAKARLLAGSPAEVVRVGEAEALRPGLYDGARLVFIAVEDEAMAEAASTAARAAGALVNVVDRQHLGDFHTPSIVDRSPIIAAIGTGGAAPIFAAQLRNHIEARWHERLGDLAALSGELQKTVREAIPDLPARRAYWRRFLRSPAADAALEGDIDTARRLAIASIDDPRDEGRVLFLQVPTRTELLTLAAVRALSDADRIVAGPEGTAEVLSFARRDAGRHDAASAEDLAAWAGEGLTVLHVSTTPDLQLVKAVRALGAKAEVLPVGS